MEDHIKTEYVIDDSHMLQCSLDAVVAPIEFRPSHGENINQVGDNQSIKSEECLIEEDDIGKEDDIVEDNEIGNEHTFVVRYDQNGSETYYCEYSDQEYDTLEEINAAHDIDWEDKIVYDEENEWDDTDILQDDNLAEIKQETTSDDPNDVQIEEEFQIIREDLSEVTNNEEIKVEKFFCECCEMIFEDLETAELHDCEQLRKLRNKNLPNYHCFDCNLDFQTSRELKVHTDEDHLTEPQTCEICNEPFLSIRAFYRHKLNDHGLPSPYECYKCKKDFKTLQSLINHVKRFCRPKRKPATSTKIPVTCKICNTQISSEKNLKYHMRTHQTKVVKSIEDVIPPAALDAYSELNQFYCEICKKSFDQKLLEIHKNMHQNIEEHVCTICNRQFENRLLYDMHLQLHASQSTKASRFPMRTEGPNGKKLNYGCQYCGRLFGKPYEKVKHERIHTGEKPYACEVCGKCFRISYSLTMHLRTHTDFRPFACSICNKRFKSKSAFDHHSRSHQEERNYQCEMCHKSFRTSVRLNAHRNSHNRPFTCPICAKRFATLHTVKTHMNVHTKTSNKSNRNQKYSCSICSVSFARAFGLRFHMKEAHEIEVNLVEDDDLNNYLTVDDEKLEVVEVQNDVIYEMVDDNIELEEIQEIEEEAQTESSSNPAFEDNETSRAAHALILQNVPQFESV